MVHTTIERIAGKLFTVVWHHKPTVCGTLGLRNTQLKDGSVNVFLEADCINHVATALPAVSLYPETSDIRLLARYMAEGIFIVWKWGGDAEGEWESVHNAVMHHQDGVELLGSGDVSVAYAINGETGEGVQIAIERN